MCLDGVSGRLSYVGGEERDANVECRDDEDGNSNIVVVIGRWIVIVNHGRGEVNSGCVRLGLGQVLVACLDPADFHPKQFKRNFCVRGPHWGRMASPGRHSPKDVALCKMMILVRMNGVQ